MSMNGKNIVVSVFMITYNHEKYIAKAIEGVISQQVNFDIELIIGEDCSSDKTNDLCIEYARKYPNIIRVLSREKNIGIHKNFYDTLDHCCGKYIAFCEGDDYWTDPLKLQKQVDFMEANKEYGLVYTNYNVYDEDKNIINKSVFSRNRCPRIFEEHLIAKGFIAPMTWLFRRELLEDFDRTEFPDITFAVALDLFKKTKIHFMDTITATYTMHKGSVSRPKSIEEQYKLHKSIFEMQLYYLKKYDCDERLFKIVYSQNYLGILPFAIELNDERFIAKYDRNPLEYKNEDSGGVFCVESCYPYTFAYWMGRYFKFIEEGEK